MSSIPLKHCIRCGESKPATPEYFRQTKRSKDGFHVPCKVCIKRAEELSRRNRGITPKAYINEQGEKQCKTCGQWKPANAECFKIKLGNLTPLCRECHREYSRQWSRLNPDKAKQGRQNFKKNHREKNQAIKTITQINRRAKRLTLAYDLTKSQWDNALDYFNHCCAVCNRPAGLWHILSADHWIPLNNPDCPGTTVTNMIPLCHGVGGCNNSKQDAMPKDWLIRRFGKRKALMILDRIERYFEVVRDGS